MNSEAWQYNSFRDIVAQENCQNHLGSEVSRSMLLSIKEDKPYSLYEALFGQLLSCCQSLAPCIISASRTRYILWMPRQLIFTFRLFYGRTS